ncbi:hypothetical protein QGP82_25510 [Leptothoe sp. LEGE 181152]|nr:hypothetical protein [Leptothoe sp. LEGE 181152]
MGLFDWFNPKEPDETVVEISDDLGDHVVFSVPTQDYPKVRRLLKKNFADDIDERIAKSNRAPLQKQRDWNIRDHEVYRYRGERVIYDDEDLYDPTDQGEADYTDYEHSAQPIDWPY